MKATSFTVAFIKFNRQCSAFLDRHHWSQYRLLVVLAALPCIFAWKQVSSLPNGFLYLAGWLSIANLGLTIGYHRYYAHKQFIASDMFKVILAFTASMSWQGSLNSWALQHRIHHSLSDQQGDPHSPRDLSNSQKPVSFKSFYHAHYGWMSHVGQQIRAGEKGMISSGKNLAYVNRLSKILGNNNRYLDFHGQYKYAHPYIVDLVQDPLERCMSDFYALFSLLSVVFVAGVAIFVAFIQAGGFGFQSILANVTSAVYWGVIVRAVLTQEMSNITNSLGHSFGYRNFETEDCSKNNVLVGLLTLGEGFQNNHHHNSMSTNFSRRWYEVDLASYFLKILFLTPLAKPIQNSFIK